MDGEPRRASPGSIERLLTRCAAGDAAAFRRLYDVQSARLYGLALRVTGRPDLAADAVHDALLRVWRGAERFGPDGGDAGAWLLAAVRYRALDLARPQARRAGDGGGEAGSAGAADAAAADAPARLGGTRDGEALRRGLDAMAPERRRLVLLAFVEGLTHPELAARTGQPPGAVRSALRRALAALRDRLDAPGASPGASPGAPLGGSPDASSGRAPGGGAT